MERVSWSPLMSLEKDAIWDRLSAGLAAKPAARELGLPTGTVRAYLARCGKTCAEDTDRRFG